MEILKETYCVDWFEVENKLISDQNMFHVFHSYNQITKKIVHNSCIICIRFLSSSSQASLQVFQLIEKPFIRSHSSAFLHIIQSLKIWKNSTLVHLLLLPHLAEAHVLLGHQVGEDTAGWPGQPHVAVHHHQGPTTHCRVDEVCRSAEIPLWLFVCWELICLLYFGGSLPWNISGRQIVHVKAIVPWVAYLAWMTITCSSAVLKTWVTLWLLR